MGYLDGQTVLLTGATGGIGAACARAIAAEGARLVLHYSSSREAAEALAAELGNGALCVQADLTDPAAPTRLWAEAEAAAGGRIHALVNNAGIRNETTVDDPLEVWHAVWAREMQVNLNAAVDLTRAAILHFREHGGGRIVNMGSRAGQRGYTPEAIPYGASKAAMMNMTRTVARSFGHEGIIAVAIAPGWVRTSMAEEFIANYGAAAALDEIPIGRMAEPDEIGELTAFALRPSQVSLSGSVLDVNGASYIR